MNRFLGVNAGVVALTIVLLWLVPPVGFVAAMVLLVILPPWGRSLSERFVISGIVLLGLVAAVFPEPDRPP